MRIEVDKLVEIQNIVDCQVEVGADYNDVITLRFGYWNQLTESDLKKVEKVLGHRSIIEDLVDEDDDCGRLYAYRVSYNPFE